MGQTEKARFYLSPSHIDTIGHANWTCQVDTLWFKKKRKETLKIKPSQMNIHFLPARSKHATKAKAAQPTHKS